MRLFGLIGYPLGHSFSAKYFNRKFRQENLPDARYSLLEMNNAGDFPQLIREHRELAGLNVTIPLKSTILKFLDELDPVAEKIGAVNCIRIRRTSAGPVTRGYNTDHKAFSETLKPNLKPFHTRALILGTGGSAQAVAHALTELGLGFRFVSRNPTEKQLSYAAVTKSLLQEYQVVINATPVGMFPRSEGLPEIPYNHLSPQNLLYDLVYNPEKTRFLQEGEKRGADIKNGLEMLFLQAEYSWRIWNVSNDSLFL